MFSLFLSQSFISRCRDQKAAQDQAEGKERGQVKKFSKIKSNSEFLLLLLFYVYLRAIGLQRAKKAHKPECIQVRHDWWFFVITSAEKTATMVKPKLV